MSWGCGVGGKLGTAAAALPSQQPPNVTAADLAMKEAPLHALDTRDVRAVRHRLGQSPGGRLRAAGAAPVSDDSDLVRRCLDGERIAWAELIDRYADLVYGLLHRAGLDRTTAADAFQEVSILLWKGLKRLRRTASLVPWLVVTSRRVAWRMKQRSKARAGRDAAVARPEAAPGVSAQEALVAVEEEQAVRRGLSRLGERCQKVLMALYFQTNDGGYDEVAARLGIPRGSIGPTRQRCLEGLRRELLALGFDDSVSRRVTAASSAPRDVRRPRRDSRR
jgi:RNA polymerase sigma factor (sigma-70 family)